MYTGRMTPARKEFNTNVKAEVPKKTLVIMVPEKDVDRIKLLIDNYADGVGLPTLLVELLQNVKRQLG